MHCVHLFQHGSLQGRCSFQLVPNQVYKDDYKKQTVCFKYFLYCKYFTVSGILAICWKDIHIYIYIYTVFYVHTDFQFTIETHSYTCDDSNIVFNRLFYLYLGPNAKDMISLLIEFVYETRDLVDGLPPRAGGYVCFSLDMMVVSSTQEYLSIGWKLHH